MAWRVILRRFALCGAAVALFSFVYPSAKAPAAAMISTLFVGGARIDVVTEHDGSQLPTDEVLSWVKSAAQSVSAYYGHFPVPQVSIHITAFRGKGVRHGMAFAADEGGRITIAVGSGTSASEFASDWTLTHEMIHLGFPAVEDRHHWIEEGIATYVEPIARIRAGYLNPERMWADLVRDMPQGLPEGEDRGLDRTHTWGRTYWGGAIFCLLADVEIRRQTRNTKGLEHALRAILEAGGDIRHQWNLAEALKAGDAATGTRVLESQYEEMKDKPFPVNLDALWADLGVRLEGRRVRFDDSAPLAAIRRAITGDQRPAAKNLRNGPPALIVAGRTPGPPRPTR